MEFICKLFALFGVGYLLFRLFRPRFDNFAKIAGFVVALLACGVILAQPISNAVIIVCGTVGLVIITIGCLDRWHAEWWHIAVPLVLAITFGLYMWAPVIFGTTPILPALPTIPPVAPIVAPPAPVPAPAPTPAPAPSPPSRSGSSRSRHSPVEDKCSFYAGFSDEMRHRNGCP